jgi:hypothetical protein
MAKKNAAPYKAARKASVRAKTAPKKVTAPLRHKPKGSAKERLAYLNKEEMAALEKRKGSPARKGPKGLPSFADDSASSKGVSRGDSSGTKGSGSTKTSSGSVSKSSESKTSNSGAGSNSSARGGGGKGGYNSGTSGSRFGGASTQKPGMGRNSGRVGPQSPMAGQGASFKNPKAARDDTFRKVTGVEDQRGLQNMPQRPYLDRKYGVTINPNKPPRDLEKVFQKTRDERDEEARRMGDWDLDDYRNPQEIRENAARVREWMDRQDAQNAAARKGLKRSEPLSQGNFKANVGRAAASGRLPDIKLGGPRIGTQGGFSGGGMGGTYRGGGWGDESYFNGRGGKGWKAGGLVKKNSNKTFKKK